MKPTQNHYTALLLLLLLLGLEIARSQTLRGFFSSLGSGISGNLSASAHSQQNATNGVAPVDWHLILYWGIAALLVLALADYAPSVVNAVLILIIVEQLLVNWSAYQSLLQVPTA